MPQSTRLRRPLPAAAALLLVLAITTGWVQATGPLDRSTSVDAAHALAGRIALAADRGVAGESDAITLASTGVANLAAHRSAEASLSVAARDLFHARVQAARATAQIAPAKVARVERPEPRASVHAYEGRNHFWIPSLGISKRVYTFECTRARDPDNYMYRWGCAGRNNVYILGHASSVMKPLYDAYYSGKLRVGMIAIYADGAGRIRAYRVTEWRVVDPVDSHWAIANQSVPSMTLQTCVGPKGVDRLNVRLVAVD
ncbi:MAG: sortase [Candidatus Limnocylindrales bacterium]